MPTYTYVCDACETVMERERPVDDRDEPVACPVCGDPARRSPSRPKLLFKGDPADNRPYWHNHDGYSHAHAPRRGRHRAPEEDHCGARRPVVPVRPPRRPPRPACSACRHRRAA